jgi:23S rRNA pseudouridine1911/1915/1917 synthase
MAVVAGGRPALTRFRTLQPLAGAALVECRLSTGRTHQIRVHLDAIGHAVLGDPVYGPRSARLAPALAAASDAIGRQALHAVELAFAHPDTGEPMRFRSTLPGDIQAALDALRLP